MKTAFENMPTAQKQPTNPAKGLGFLGISMTDPLAQKKPLWGGSISIHSPEHGSQHLERQFYNPKNPYRKAWC